MFFFPCRLANISKSIASFEVSRKNGLHRENAKCELADKGIKMIHISIGNLKIDVVKASSIWALAWAWSFPIVPAKYECFIAQKHVSEFLLYIFFHIIDSCCWKLWEAQLMSSHFVVFAAGSRLFQNLGSSNKSIKHQRSAHPSSVGGLGPTFSGTCGHMDTKTYVWETIGPWRISKDWFSQSCRFTCASNVWSDWAISWSRGQRPLASSGLILLDVGLRPDVIWFPIPHLANRKIRTIRNHQQTCTHQSPKEQTSEWWKMIETKWNQQRNYWDSRLSIASLSFQH